MRRLVICPSCRAWVAPDERRCVHCGASAPATAQRVAPLFLGVALAGCPGGGDEPVNSESAAAYGVPDTFDGSDVDSDASITSSTSTSSSSESSEGSSSEGSSSDTTGADTSGSDSGSESGSSDSGSDSGSDGSSTGG